MKDVSLCALCRVPNGDLLETNLGRTCRSCFRKRRAENEAGRGRWIHVAPPPGLKCWAIVDTASKAFAFPSIDGVIQTFPERSPMEGILRQLKEQGLRITGFEVREVEALEAFHYAIRLHLGINFRERS